MNKYVVIVLSVVIFLIIIVCSIFGLIYYKNKINTIGLVEATSSTLRREIPEPSIKISKYILTGTVTFIKDNEISITLERLFEGDNGNYLATDNKIVRISSSTQVVSGRILNKKYSEIPARYVDIKEGQSLTFYSGENIKVMPVFSPYKIIISQ